MTSKKRKNLGGIFKYLKERIAVGFARGIEESAKKLTVLLLGLVGALILALTTFFFADGVAFFQANIFGGAEKGDLATLIADADDGAVIDLSGKTYGDVALVITKKLTLKGDIDTIVMGKPAEDIITLAENADLTLDGMAFASGKMAIVAEEGARLTVKNCLFADNEVAISAANAAAIHLENNFFEQSSDTALHLSGITDGTINKNTFINNRIAVMAENSTLKITANMVKNSNDQAFYLFSDGSEIVGNVVNRVYYSAAVNFRKGTHATELHDNFFGSAKIGLYAVNQADTTAVKAYKNTFIDISENEMVLTGSDPNNFYENQSKNNWSDVVISDVGCSLEICL